MSKVTRAVLFTAITVSLWAQSAQATPLSLSGSTSWQINSTSITINADRVSNTSSTGSSGSIRLQVWATASRYTGGGINGYIMGTYQFPQVLGPNQYYSAVSQTVAYTAPPNGTYYTTLTAEEFTSSGWVIRDYVTFASTSTFGPGGGGGGGGGSPAVLTLSGATSWQVNGTSITINADRVSNTSSSGSSGSVRLQVWATALRYAGGAINGYILGSYQFPQVLGPNQYYSAVSQPVTYTAPPNGTYYTTLALEEFTGSGWAIRDYVTFASTSTFGPGGGGGGGGGSPAVLTLSGATSWQVNGTSITINADRVSNTSSSGTSGSIRLQVWATALRYAGGAINGYILGSYQFPQVLGPNQYYSAVSQPVMYTAPPNGTYYTTLALEEYTGTSWAIRDYVTFASPSTFGPGGGGVGSSPAVLTLSGATSWQVNGASITLNAATVVNSSSSGTSGSIRLQVWATASPYAGGAINGYVLGTYQFGYVLPPGYQYGDVSQTVAFTPPPNGTYHTTMTLEEYTGSTWAIRDYRTYSSSSTWGPRTFSVPDHGGYSITSNGTSSFNGQVESGYAVVQPTTIATPAGVAIFGLRTNGVVTSEAGVPASPLLQSGRIYAEVNGAVNTGLAIANPSNQTAVVAFYFTRTDGTDFGTGSITVPARGQIAKFLNEPPFNSGLMQGTFSYTSSIPVSVIALRGLTNERGDFLMTTLPVSFTAATPATVTLPHFAAGGGWTTQILLVNPSDSTLTGTLQFRNAAGQNVAVTASGQTTSSFSYSISRRSSFKLTATGGSATVGGSVRITPSSGPARPASQVIFSYRPGAITISEAGAAAMESTAFRVYGEANGPIQSGLAIANPSASAVTARIELYRLDGSYTNQATNVTIPANGQTAKFLNELFPGLSSFQGIIRITSSGPSLAVVGLRSRSNERGDFLITTTPPTNELSSPTVGQVVFPHIANGGGYTTQVILFSGTTGEVTAGALQFFTKDGTTFQLQFD